MTAKKIMELLLQGKKLRSIKWNKTEYVCLDKQGNLVDEAGNIHSLYLLSCIDELKEYIEYVDFFTAMKHIANGGKAQRKGLYGMLSLDDKGNLVYKDSEYKDGKNSKYASEADFYLILNKNDIDSQEWILF